MSSKPSNEEHPRTIRSITSYVPNIYVLRPPRGMYSRKTDERCFIYCTQTAAGRTNRQTPQCRSICLRKVFSHEVYKLLTIADPTLPKPKLVPIKQQIPLPREGQDPASFFFSTVDKEEDDALSKKGKDKEVRHWDQGWYLWYSRDPWAAREKISMMSLALDQQAVWEAYKSGANVKWSKGEADGFPEGSSGGWRAVGLTPAKGVPPFPDLIGETLMMPIEYPSLEPLQRMLRNVLAPTGKILNVLREHIKSGAFLELKDRLWDKAKGPDPWILARNSIQRASEFIQQIADEDDEDDKPKGL